MSILNLAFLVSDDEGELVDRGIFVGVFGNTFTTHEGSQIWTILKDTGDLWPQVLQLILVIRHLGNSKLGDILTLIRDALGRGELVLKNGEGPSECSGFEDLQGTILHKIEGWYPDRIQR